MNASAFDWFCLKNYSSLEILMLDFLTNVYDRVDLPRILFPTYQIQTGKKIAIWGSIFDQPFRSRSLVPYLANFVKDHSSGIFQINQPDASLVRLQKRKPNAGGLLLWNCYQSPWKA